MGDDKNSLKRGEGEGGRGGEYCEQCCTRSACAQTCIVLVDVIVMGTMAVGLQGKNKKHASEEHPSTQIRTPTNAT